MRLSPVWSKLTALAHTLPYDDAIVRDFQRVGRFRSTRWAPVTVATLVRDGGKSPGGCGTGDSGTRAGVAERAIPHARRPDAQLKPKAHAPTLVEFFNS